MGTSRHLSRAPIVEALIQINVDLPSNTDLAPAIAAHERFKSLYPKARKKFLSEFKIDASQGQSPSTVVDATQVVGYLYINDAETRIAQFGVQSFSFNWLRPYEDWQSFRDAARAMWQIYLETLKPNTVTRIGLRYINDLAVPLPISGFAEVLTAPPSIPPALPRSLSSFFDRVVLEDQKRGFGAIIMRTIEVQPNAGLLPLILDIDVFKDLAAEATSDGIWEVLDNLRDFKNEAFFGSITDHLEENYV